MKKKYQNGFFFFGLALLALMLSQLDFAEVWNGLRRAGYWFFAVVALWLFLYLFNTFTWYIIIKASGSQTNREASGEEQTEDGKSQTERKKKPVSFAWLYKITVSGFALNYATPGGLMGGEPYRIMELSPKIGSERASSSVILFAMTHIFSHFWFWLFSIALYLLTRPLNFFMGSILVATGLFCCLGVWFFISGYRKGLANRALNLLRHFPWISKWATEFINRNKARLDEIDKQIAALHKQSPKTFFTAVISELVCRILSALEVYFILLVLYPSVDYGACILIIAFTTLFANLLFFMPLQIGGREGGFMMSITALSMTVSDSIFVALIVRIRELIWTAIGLLLIKWDKKGRTV
ncbi:MAG: lysylphosphatidylglycerol synthase transmembrane domain-containing protein [Prevotella sp.]|nr:lysylphosphatidylglycerol synthase transmembrane domain-containing protein [Prevotella sp.]